MPGHSAWSQFALLTAATRGRLGVWQVRLRLEYLDGRQIRIDYAGKKKEGAWQGGGGGGGSWGNKW